MKISAVLIAALLSTSTSAVPAAQNSALLQKARDAYDAAQSLEAELNQKPETERLRADYLNVINAYQRVYVITPQTSYADDALVAIAKIYEELKEPAQAAKTLQFLIREYPATPFKDAAENDVARLTAVSGGKKQRSGSTVAVDNVRYFEGQNSLRIIADLGGEISFRQGDAKKPDRVFVDLSPAKLSRALIGKQWPVESNLLQQIRIGQYDASTVRIVLNVGSVSRVSTLTLREPDRLVIDLFGTEGVAASANSAQAPKPAMAPPPKAAVADAPLLVAKTAAVVPLPAAARKNTDESAKTITPAKTPASGTPSLVRTLGLKLARVVIDAGHGGHDTGTIGQNGYMEKELVLDVARRLKRLIESELDAEVVMTRNDDTFVPLETRTAIANQQQADLFISIHANSSSSASVRGVETYFLNFSSYSRDALETAARENASSDRSIHDLQDLVKKIMLQDKVDESRELAEHIGKALAARKGAGADRGIKQAPFVVLVGANMPSVLAEICFISNPQDEKLARTPEQRQAIAASLFEGVRSYANTLSGNKTAKTQEKTN